MFTHLIFKAFRKRAWQSSTFWSEHGDASRAVDGNPSTDYWRQLSCTRTKEETNPWWTVDLQAVFKIDAVIITNREDCCGWFQILHFLFSLIDPLWENYLPLNRSVNTKNSVSQVIPLYFLADRLSNFTISVSSKFKAENFKATKWTTCSHVPGRLEAGETRTIVCNETVTGRFVSLHLNNEGILTICELQVEGRQISQTKIEGLIFT